MKITRLFILMVLLSCLGCTNSTLNETTIENKQEGKIAEEPVDSALQAKVNAMLGVGYPRLNEENAVAFLADWFEKTEEREVVIHTKHGDIFIDLFDETPLHTANFLYKVHRQYFAPCEFTRVVPEFVIQGGNSEEEEPQQKRFFIGKHTLPSEFVPGLYHSRGSVAMSRGYSDNPDKRSSSYDFYIVTGRKISKVELAQIEHEKGISYTDAQKKLFRNVGGAPHLDFEHTVFGRVTKGMDVADKIAATPRDESDWPLEKLNLTIELVQD